MDTLFPYMRRPGHRMLFVDMNAFFASVEQQDRPDLRGRPVGVAPVIADTTCCIAASYEAKAFNVKTGTSVKDAKKRCPGITIVEARPELYLSYHHRIVDVLQRHFADIKVLSVDEMACRLSPRIRTAQEEVAAVRALKQSLRLDLGEFMRCSIGVAPNVFLAKVAGDMKKPDGLTVWDDSNLPDALCTAPLQDLPGIGKAMQRRLSQCGIETTRHLFQASEADLRSIWKSVVGARWYYMLRGSLELDYQPAMQGTGARKSVGHSNVLAPEYRTLNGAVEILIELIGKALQRLRGYRQLAGGVALSIQYRPTKAAPDRALRIWTRRSQRHLPKNDDLSWSKILFPYLSTAPDLAPYYLPSHVAVTFSRLILEADRNLSLFDEDEDKLKLSMAIDMLNKKIKGAVKLGMPMESRVPLRIPFGAPEPM